MNNNTASIRKVVCVLSLAWAMVQLGEAASTSSITAGFNGTDIDDTSAVWFNSHITGVSGGTNPINLYFLNQALKIETQTNGTFNYVLPDAIITIVGSPTNSTNPSTVFSGGWITTVPDDSGTPFLAGFTLDVPAGVQLKAADVTWSGEFFTDLSDFPLSGAWQWSAAVYTNFSGIYNALGVTPVDGFAGFSQSGTPANFTDYVVGGARGGGGSNFTGSNSGTESFDAAIVPEPTTLGLIVVGTLGAAVVWLRQRRRFRA